jgi:hypothetical protein
MTLTKADWPSSAEMARELARDEEPTGRVAAAMADLGWPTLSRAQRQELARRFAAMARSDFARPGGKARMARMSNEERSSFARLGGLARREKGREE